MERLAGTVVLPGSHLCTIDDLTNSYKNSEVTKIELGPGLRRSKDSQSGREVVESTYCGILQHRMKIKHAKSRGPNRKRTKIAADSVPVSKTASFWIDAPVKRYEPKLGDRVVSIVLTRTQEHARVTLGNCDAFGMLPRLAFENATRRNRPDLLPGDCVFARVVAARQDCEPELSCVAPGGRAYGLGVLHGAASVKQHGSSTMHCTTVVRVDVRYTRALLSVGKHMDKDRDHNKDSPFPFELVAGANGIVFVSARSIRELYLVVRAIRRLVDDVQERADGQELMDVGNDDKVAPEDQQRQKLSALSRFFNILNQLADSSWEVK